MTLGYLTALVQTNVVRLLAYSSVAQAGYFLLGIVALGASPLALPAIIVFGAAYVAMNLGAFAVVMVAGRHLDDFGGLGRRRPVIGLAMVVFLLSLTGIPPLFGFVGKVYLFGAAIEAGFLWLAVIAILNSVLALGVYLRIMVPMYASVAAPSDAAPIAPPLAWAMGIAVIVTILMGAFVGILPG
jgi:NADH-quinone oxidoreductase subunit N